MKSPCGSFNGWSLRSTFKTIVFDAFSFLLGTTVNCKLPRACTSPLMRRNCCDVNAFYFHVMKGEADVGRRVWIVRLVLKWLPWPRNQINGFQLGKPEWHSTANVTRGLPGCKGRVAMAMGRQAPKPRQKKKQNKGIKKEKDGCHSVLIIEDGADRE